MATALWLLCLPQVTAQQEAETPTEEIVSPPEETADSAMDENNGPAGEMPNDSETTNPAEEAFQRAMQHEEKNELEEAIGDCTEAIRLDPNNIEYLNGRAHLYGEMRNQDKAMADAAKALELDPTNVRARALRGRMLELSGDPQKALIEFNTAVEQNPTSVQALSERQYYFLRQGQDDKAMADADRMVQLQPNSAAGNVARALSGTPDQAMNYASAAVQQDPENWFAYKLRGFSRAQDGDFAGATSDFDKALELSPDNAHVFSARAVMHYMQGDYGKGLADSQKAADLEPRNCSILALLADRLATCPDSNLRNGTKASEYAVEALRLNANEPLVWRACASAAAVNGNFEEAKKWEERLLNSNVVSPNQKAEDQGRLLAYNSGKPYLEKRPTVDEALADKKIEQANEAIRNGNFDRAIALLSEVIDKDDKRASAHTSRGFAYFKEDKYDLALTDFTAAIRSNANYSDAYYYRARLFQRTRQYSKVFDDLRMVEKLEPQNASDAKNTLAWFLATCPDEQVRNGGLAAEYADSSLELSPNNPKIWDTCAAVFAENDDFEAAVDWEQAYVDRTDITEDERGDGEKRLALYKRHQPYRNEPQAAEAEVNASTTPAQPGK